MKWTWNRQPLCSEQCESVCRVCCALWSTRWTRWNNSSWTFQSSLHAVCHRFSIIPLFAKSSFLEPLKWKTNFGVVFLGFFFFRLKCFLNDPWTKFRSDSRHGIPSYHSRAQQYIGDAHSIDLMAWRRPALCSRNVTIRIRSDHVWRQTIILPLWKCYKLL